ncbi:hypothetical protein V6N11_005014 [Hibiscus sabdariffa]|uniref:Uncharacterized protein n=1 Tax=Hibiscus sabdariffa TaxID=183260 RepID=A0ABR2NHM1_9ROSI
MVEDPIFAGVNSSPPRRGKDSSPDDFDSWCEPFLEEATKVILFVVMLLGDLLVLKGHLARGRALLASLHVVRVYPLDFPLVPPTHLLIVGYWGEGFLVEKIRKTDMWKPVIVETLAIPKVVCPHRGVPEMLSELAMRSIEGGGSLSSLPPWMGAPAVWALKSFEREVEVSSCFCGACYAKSTRLASEAALIGDRLQSSLCNTSKDIHFMLTDVRATCAHSRDEVAAKNDELFEANMRLTARDQELFEANSDNRLRGQGISHSCRKNANEWSILNTLVEMRASEWGHLALLLKGLHAPLGRETFSRAWRFSCMIPLVVCCALGRGFVPCCFHHHSPPFPMSTSLGIGIARQNDPR